MITIFTKKLEVLCMPAVSVIVPVYNVEPYLPRCIESILAQSFRDFELILVNDGSTDKSGAICDKYTAEDARIRVIHQENRGIAAVRNVSLEWAFHNSDSGWIAFVDSDDYIADTYLERLYENAMQSKADIATCAMAIFDDQVEVEKISREPTEVIAISGLKACEEVYQINGLVKVTCWGKLIRKTLFENIKFPEGKTHEDEAMIPRVIYKAGRIAVCKDPLYYYYQSTNSIMRKPFSIRRFEAIEAIDSCIEFFEQHQEMRIAEEARKRRTVLLALSVAYARRAGLYDEIPEQYRIPEWKAMYRMQQCVSFDEFSWHLGKFYPKLVRPYSYLWKIMKILHIAKEPC